MKKFNDFDNNQDYVDYIKVNDVVTYNNLLDFIAYENKMTDNTYTVNDVVEDSELFGNWYELL